MSNFQNIQSKLQAFVKKYYKNELIKGLILFSAFGLLYFIFTLFIESIFWLQPLFRTILFWLFIFVELSFLVKYILIPISKIIGLKKGISLEVAAEIIGTHFKEVDDKLLNVLQLQQDINQSDLLLASIEQKSRSLEPIPFKRAIDFTKNSKYLKYLSIPIFIWLFTVISGNNKLFFDSYERVVHHQTYYEPPAPFTFIIQNDNLDVIEGKPITIVIKTEGKTIPEDVMIHFKDQNYFTQNKAQGKFEYLFSSIQKPISFYVESNGIKSKEYHINVIPTPVITDFIMELDYPSYTHKKDELVKNTGNAIVPQGTKITWKLKGRNTDVISFNSKDSMLFKLKSNNDFEFEKSIFRKLNYEITTSNSQLQNYEALSFTVDVVADGYPKIDIRSDIDSITIGPVQFVGQLSDDYGLQKLRMVYYDKNNSKAQNEYIIPIQKSSFEEFYYVFPDGVELLDGVDYELYFEVFDNDAVNDNKSSKSATFSYYKKTESELKEQILEDQKESISDLEKSIDKSKEVKDDLKKMEESLQNKSEMNWNDQKKLEIFLQRQEQYENMMQRQTEEINQNLEEQPENQDKELENKKEDIQKRLEEAKELAKQEQLREELKKLAEKLNKEELTEKLKKLTENNRQNERNLERILELTKRFYVEQKANQIKEKLEGLSKKQDKLADEKENSLEKQKELNKEFEGIKNDLDDLDKENNGLQKPMDLPKTDKEEKAIDKDQNEATDKLEESESNKEENSNSEKSPSENKKSASKKQKSAAQKMKQMSQKMQQSLQSMQGESMDEDIGMLRVILENLLAFSFQQEDLMNDFSEIDNAHPDFSNKLKQQHVLKEYFEHIDDSLYTLSMRQPKLGTKIFKDLSDAHYHLYEALNHFAENQFDVGISDQQFVMTAANNITYLLSNILNSMQNANPSMGQGLGDSFGLPDIIQRQEDAIGKMEDGIKKGMKPGDKDGENGSKGKEGDGENGQQSGEGQGEQMSGELYEIYKQQAQLRKLLEEALKDKKGVGNGAGKEALKQMEQLEQDILEKGFTNETLQKMMQIKHQLLKLQEAAHDQGIDSKRKSDSNKIQFKNRTINEIDGEKLWFNQNEILNRQSLPLQPRYKKKVQEYFKANDSIQ
ncbi:MAG: hypothetical protein PSN34_16170 [Urechidicola sp.]|nr:hypothetical protein [Urechidicola sp.]